MPVELKLVATPDQVRQSLASFNAEVRSYPARALSLLHQTTYFVYDDDAEDFGPAKYVGFVEMSFAKYEQALRHDHRGDPFDGFATRRAIESTFSTAFAPDEQLQSRLEKWAEALLGPGVFEGVDKTKWAFVRVRVPRNYWALMANPEMYNIQQAVSELTEDDWLVQRSDVKSGDRVAIWKAKGRSNQRGIVALGEALTNPATMLPRPESEKYYLEPMLMTAQRRVVVRYVLPAHVPHWMENDKSGVLDSLSVAHATGGTVFKISPSQWHKLVEVLGGWPPSQARPEEGAVQAADVLRSASQGFQSDSAVRQAVEEYAMKRAESHFVSLGYSVERVGKPYDLRCSRGADVLYVEVKGTQTQGADILLTPNEVSFANTHRNEMALFVLHDVTISRVNGNIVPNGGIARIEPNWVIDVSRLSSLGYSYVLPEEKSTSRNEM
jgi:Domain of unknown function (DUF3883)/EVE domain